MSYIEQELTTLNQLDQEKIREYKEREAQLNYELRTLVSKFKELETLTENLENDNKNLKQSNKYFEDKLHKKTIDNNEKTETYSYLLGKLENSQSDLKKYRIKYASKRIPILDISLGFILGFGFVFLLLFILWFVSFYTESVSNFYKTVFCNNTYVTNEGQ
jgi:predicted transcriptional regulator